MGYIDRQLDQVQALLNQGNAAAAHQLVRGIAMDEPQNQRAQALLADATRRLQNQPPPLYTQQQPQYPPRPVYMPPPATKRNPLAAIFLTLIVVIVGGAFILNATTSGGSRATPGRNTFSGNPASSSLVSVTLSVTTEENGYVDLTYTNASGGIEQKKADTPWTQTFKVKPGTFVSVSAQATRAMTVNCKITGDGATIQQATSSGSYVIASCSGSAR